jgi:hypothetical protein
LKIFEYPPTELLIQSFPVGLQIEIADKPAQAFGVNSQKACRLD